MRRNPKNIKKKRVVLAITGASGSPYSKRFLDVLLDKGCGVDVVLSATGKKIWCSETGQNLGYFSREGVSLNDNTNLFTPMSSGSRVFDGMVILPASMGTIGRVASGVSDSLITRTAEVALKERRTLVVVPRESPYSRIHLTNMLKLDRAGAVILPASPGFYHNPSSIAEILDFIVARILAHLDIEQDILPGWTP